MQATRQLEDGPNNPNVGPPELPRELTVAICRARVTSRGTSGVGTAHYAPVAARFNAEGDRAVRGEFDVF